MSIEMQATAPAEGGHIDAIVVGAGFAGLRMLIELRKRGLSAIAIESGPDVGGTWYWNRYPGARTDSESWVYCFPFEEIEEEWDHKERFTSQQDVQGYLSHLANRFDLRRDIRFSTKVVSAIFNESSNLWEIGTNDGSTLTARFFITGLGLLSAEQPPPYDGIESFAGETYLTSRWPEEPVDFAGKRVAVIGTGASGIQIIPIIAEEAKHLTVFQRTPNFVIPAGNHELDDEKRESIRRNYPAIWRQAQSHSFGFAMNPAGRVYDDVTEEERERIFEEGWRVGGFQFVFETFDDLMIDQRSNDAAAEFIRKKIRETVHDPAVAELLTPRGYPFIAKRPPSGAGYYETYNRDNVTLVDINQDPIQGLTQNGLSTAGGEHEFDIIVFATGFDAVTGALARIDIRGEGGRKLTDFWQEGPETYLGIATPGFPNMFMISGPQSAYANIPVVIEKLVGWIGRALDRIDAGGYDRMQPTTAAAQEWSAHIDELFKMTVLPSDRARSWYLGANIPGKPQKVLFYFGGAAAYFDTIETSASNDFAGFEFSRTQVTVAS